MRAVNLLPRDEKGARLDSRRTPLLAAAGGIAAVTVLFAFLGFSASGSADDKRAELERVEAAIAKLPQAGSGLSSGLISQERTSRVAALGAALSTQISFDRLLRQVSLVLPDDVWLTSLTAASPAGAAGTPSTPATPATSGATQPAGSAAIVIDTVTIQGTTYTQEAVAHLLARLAVVPTLSNVRLTSTTLGDSAATQSQPAGQPAAQTKPGKKVVTFIITAALRTGGTS
jgi:Tfp pilus assembly protein PilN